MSDEIVSRLRVWSDWLDERCPDTAVMSDLREAADEIERLREALRIECEECAACAIDRKETQRERDEARWRLCKVVGDNRGVWGCEIAKENGWDYLATEAKP
jgi:hypothetical protein